MADGELANNKSILVLGGGVIGLCTAYYAMQAGHKVTIVERGKPDHDSCSLGNAGMIVPSHFVPLAAPGMVTMGLKMMLDPESPFTVRPRLDADLMRWGWNFLRAANAAHVARTSPLLRDMSLLSRKSYEELSAQYGNSFGLVQKGLLMLCKSESTLSEEKHMAEKAHALGLAAEVLTPEETAALDPGIDMNIAGSVYFPQDCHLDPRRFVVALTKSLTEGGAKFLWGTDVRGWKTAEAQVQSVETSGGSLTADEYVLAGGSWFAEMARGLGLRLPLQAGKGYSLTLQTPRQLPMICSIMAEARVAVTPMGGTLRFGGTMEICGLDTTVNAARVRGIIKSIPDFMPAFTPEDFREVPVWTGLRPCSPDGLPYIGRPARYRNVAIATGHAMMGLSLGPVTGKLMADILSDRQPTLDISLLSPDRYA